MNKFKVGDKVTPIKGRENCTTKKLGDVGVVKSFDEIGVNIDFDGNEYKGANYCNWELVKENKMKFKIGARVRAKKLDSRFPKGAMGTLVEIDYTRDSPIHMVKWDAPHGCRPPNYSSGEGNADCSESNLELIGENMSNTSELEELVKKANEGYKARDLINEKYRDKVEFNGGKDYPWTSNWIHCEDGKQYRVKVVLKFESFSVGKCWLVKLEGETLHIGCQTFNAKQLKVFLEGSVRDKTPQGCGFNCSRKGLYHTSKNEWLTWDEAEKILVALEKAGV